MSSTITAPKGSTALSTGTVAPALVFDTALPTEAQIMSAFTQACADQHTGGTLLWKATQRTCYAIMCELKVSGSNRTLADCLTASDTKEEMLATMVKHFLPKGKPDTSNMTDDQTGTANADYNAKRQLIARAFDFGMMLDSRGVSHAMFNAKLGCFAVWSTMLTPAKATPVGRLAANLTVMLDGRSVAFAAVLANGGTKTRNANASITHLKSVCGKVKPRAGKNAAGDKAKPGDKVTDGATMSLSKPTDVADHVQWQVIIGAAHEALVARATHDMPRKADAPDATWNQLSELMTAFDKWRHGPDWLTARDSESKAEIAKRTADAKAKANRRKAS